MKNKFSFLNTILIIFILLTIMIIIYQYNHPEVKVIANEPKPENSLISMLVEQADGTYEESQENVWNNDKYIFNEKLSGCEQGSKLSYDGKNIQVDASKSDKCYAYFDYVKLNDYLIKLHTSEGANQIYYHDGLGEYPNSNLEAGDYSYRYSGSSETVKNYVCFGSDNVNCPNDNLYRIIGLFRNEENNYEIKLIKADFANKNLLGGGTSSPNGSIIDYTNNGSYAGINYNTTAANNEVKDAFAHRYRGNLGQVDRYRYQENGTESTKVNWLISLLNVIHLNYNFLNTFSSTWQEKIVDYKWHYIGSSFNNITVANKNSSNTIRTVYDYEIGSNADKTLTEPIKIGLEYVSDYLYAAGPNNWNKKPLNGSHTYSSESLDSNGIPQGTYSGLDGTDYGDAINENWSYMGLWEWTITQRTDADNVHGFVINAAGFVASHGPVAVDSYGVRPVFYLNASTKLASGNGSKDSPYRLKL